MPFSQFPYRAKPTFDPANPTMTIQQQGEGTTASATGSGSEARSGQPTSWRVSITKQGASTLAVGGILVIGGWLLVWPSLVLIGGTAVAVVAAAVGSVVRRPRLMIERQVHPPRVAKGMPAIIYLHLTNRGRRSLPPTDAVQPYGEHEVTASLPKLYGGQSGIRTYRLPTSNRGVFHMAPLQIRRSDPLELLKVTQNHGGDEQIWVYPKIHPLTPLPSGRTRHLDGPTSDTSAQGSITFHRIREYVHGDDLRMIHWRSTAKTGRYMARHNVDTSQPYTVVLLDIDPESYESDDFETAVDFAASVISGASEGRFPVQLRTSDGRKVGGRGPTGGSVGTSRALDFLTSLRADGSGSLSDELKRLRRELGGTALVAVTGRTDDSVVSLCSEMKHRFDRVVLVSVSDHPMIAPAGSKVAVIRATDAQQLCTLWEIEIRR